MISLRFSQSAKSCHLDAMIRHFILKIDRMQSITSKGSAFLVRPVWHSL